VDSNRRGSRENWEVAVATKLVKSAQVVWECLQDEDPNDLVQDCLVHWYRNKGKYDPSRGASQKTYMARVIQNKIQDLVDHRMAKKRNIGNHATSLDQPLGDDDGSRTLMEEMTEDGAPESSRDYASDIDRRLDLKRALQKLTDRQRQICNLITDDDLSMVGIADRLGLHRSTLYDEIARIKNLFAKEGLGIYLKKSPTLRALPPYT